MENSHSENETRAPDGRGGSAIIMPSLMVILVGLGIAVFVMNDHLVCEQPIILPAPSPPPYPCAPLSLSDIIRQQTFGHEFKTIARSMSHIIASTGENVTSAVHLGIPACFGAASFSPGHTIFFVNPLIERGSDSTTVMAHETSPLYGEKVEVTKFRHSVILLKYIDAFSGVENEITVSDSDAILFQHVYDIMNHDFAPK